MSTPVFARTSRLQHAIGWAILLFVTAVGSARGETPNERLAAQALDVLRRHCAKCHGPDSTGEGNVRYILDAKKLAANKKIIPGDPARSKLLKYVRDGEMPPEDEKVRPSKEEIAVLEEWIKSGAPARGEGTDAARPFLSEKDTLTAVRDHLRKTERADRRFQRYFTLHNLHNTKSITQAELRQCRAALSKVVNSLSWKSTLVVLEPVDAAQTVFAIDLRKLDWDRFHLWTEILRHYPYGLKHDRCPDDVAINELAREVYEQSDCDLPVVRADWFIATATRPPLYHTMLRLPRTAGELERLLRVDVAGNFARDQLARAGFATSGVSGQNRLIERHESAYGAYWKSYDFKSNDGRGNLFTFPLGPEWPDHPFPQQAFRHDGGEVIFNLPNGLQGYLLVNGKDERIDAGPIEVVSDGLKTSGTSQIVNGLSCLACHNRGIKSEFKDTVRDGAAAEGAVRDKLRRLYPKPDDMRVLVREDEERFLGALDRATGRFLKIGPDRDKGIQDFPEPVGPLARMYLLRELGLGEAATELGLADANELKTALQSNDALRRLGLGPLATGATIKRETWESRAKFNSPFQEAANALERGTPKNCQ